MAKRYSYSTVAVTVCFFLIVSLYILFPSVYVFLSQPLFALLYDYNAPAVDVLNESEYVYAGSEEVTALHVVARPPQTPYDSMLVTVPYGEENLTDRYVYSYKGFPIGYVHEQRGSMYIVVLFSSSLSKEIFSVNGYVTEGKGIGSGSFLLSVPMRHEAPSGTPIIHQHSGDTAGFVEYKKEISERNINHLISTIGVNPIQTSVVYIPRNGGKRYVSEDIETVLKNLEDEVTGDSTDPGGYSN